MKQVSGLEAGFGSRTIYLLLKDWYGIGKSNSERCVHRF